ncbi:MAG: Gfo/Idh/MocA family oxidoreductase [Phycisphaerae bacterium]|nr:Gfo/Idh/MocA family oxidoreductase [Phycisphaerae bacterium]
MAKKKTYGLGKESGGPTIAAPNLPYHPKNPRRYNPPIGLIGCGGISEQHLTAYRKAGYNVVALCDLIPERAENGRRQFFPDAQTYTDYRDLLKRDDIEVVDIATHPKERAYLIPASLKARKHTLSQKPFVLDLDKGYHFAKLADQKGVLLAVNQNGRWAPQFAYTRLAVGNGLLGDILAAHLHCHWNHDWITPTIFNRVHHIILYDYAIHWFDILTCIMGDAQAKRVYATICHAHGQTATPPLLGETIIEYDGAQATLAFDGFTQFGQLDTIYVAGTKRTINSQGKGSGCHEQLLLSTTKGIAAPKLEGSWFPGGFLGSMSELLRAVEEKRSPLNSARDNLRGLAVCFAAVISAETGQPQIPGKIRKLTRNVSPRRINVKPRR